MSHDDDDGGDDAKLRSLRAVWLAMPDEDPPERGLDALMAAARTKAAEMAEGSTELPKQTEKRPSWWERFVGGYGRPAVLAMATVMVLVAGAVLVGNRSMKDSAPTMNNARPSSEDVPAERREHETLKDNAPPPAAPEVTGAGGRDEKGSTNGPQHLGATPHQATQEGAVKETSKTGEAVTSDRWQAVPMDPTAEEVAKTKLLDDAKTAAARGDCNSARSVARQLEKQDVGFYRSRVVPDHDIAGCLQGRTGATAIDSATSTMPAE